MYKSLECNRICYNNAAVNNSRCTLEHEAVDDQHILPLPVAVSVQVKPPCVHEAVQPLLVTDEVTLADVLHQCPQLLLPVNPGHSHLHLLPLQPPTPAPSRN